MTAGHRGNLANHDAVMVASLKSLLGGQLHGDHVEFEMLHGLGAALLDSLPVEGCSPRQDDAFDYAA